MSELSTILLFNALLTLQAEDTGGGGCKTAAVGPFDLPAFRLPGFQSIQASCSNEIN